MNERLIVGGVMLVAGWLFSLMNASIDRLTYKQDILSEKIAAVEVHTDRNLKKIERLMEQCK